MLDIDPGLLKTLQGWVFSEWALLVGTEHKVKLAQGSGEEAPFSTVTGFR